jgi:hypothetical protein
VGSGDGVLVLAAAGPNGHVAHGAAGRPVPLAVLAELARLADVVVVEVAEFGVHAVAAGARQHLVRPLQLLLEVGLVIARRRALGVLGVHDLRLVRGVLVRVLLGIINVSRAAAATVRKILEPYIQRDRTNRGVAGLRHGDGLPKQLDLAVPCASFALAHL